MDEDRFQRLVAFTRQSFMSHHQPEWDEGPAETRLRVFEKVLPQRGRDEYLHGLIADSATSKHAWDSVKLIAESLLRGNEPLPVELRQWIADVLADRCTPSRDKRRPRPTKGSREQNRDWVICGAVHHVGLRFDLPPTRNGGEREQCCAKGGSACDVVGAAYGAMTYKNAERIWAKRDPLLSYSTGQKD